MPRKLKNKAYGEIIWTVENSTVYTRCPNNLYQNACGHFKNPQKRYEHGCLRDSNKCILTNEENVIDWVNRNCMNNWRKIILKQQFLKWLSTVPELVLKNLQFLNLFTTIYNLYKCVLEMYFNRIQFTDNI